MARGTNYKVLLASITYFKASLGDEVVILIPKGAPATWAAVENVIKKFNAEGELSAPVISESLPLAAESLESMVEKKPKVSKKKVEEEEDKVPLVEM